MNIDFIAVEENIKKMQDKQDFLFTKLVQKLNKEEIKELREIINIEYRLTMIEEGHNPETILI